MVARGRSAGEKTRHIDIWYSLYPELPHSTLPSSIIPLTLLFTSFLYQSLLSYRVIIFIHHVDLKELLSEGVLAAGHDRSDGGKNLSLYHVISDYLPFLVCGCVYLFECPHLCVLLILTFFNSAFRSLLISLYLLFSRFLYLATFWLPCVNYYSSLNTVCCLFPSFSIIISLVLYLSPFPSLVITTILLYLLIA